jgi:hypothetical protein
MVRAETSQNPLLVRHKGSPRKKAQLPPGVKILPLRHHSQSTDVWCWAASIAMVAEFLGKKPVSDCFVASRLDKTNGGEAHCCTADGEPDTPRCVRPGKSQDMMETMKWYFQLTPTLIHHALKWDEVKGSIDSGYPMIAGLYLGGRMGHAVVISGYAEPGYLIINDPAGDAMDGVLVANYSALLRKRMWVSTWYLRQDETAGYLSGGGKPSTPPPLSKATGKAPLSKVTAALPKLKDPALKFVNARLPELLPAARDCFDLALIAGAQVPSPTTVRLSFGVDKGNPFFIQTKDPGKLPADATRCIADTVSRWTGLFPVDGSYDDSQWLDLTFTKLEAAAPNAPAAAAVPAQAAFGAGSQPARPAPAAVGTWPR